MNFGEWVELVGKGVDAAGIAIIAGGAIIATIDFVIQVQRRRNMRQTYRRYRMGLGRAILLGLELLVAADIIGTVAVEPNLANLIVLGLIVLIRTFLSISLEVEIDGRWPWQKGRRRDSQPGV